MKSTVLLQHTSQCWWLRIYKFLSFNTNVKLFSIIYNNSGCIFFDIININELCMGNLGKMFDSQGLFYNNFRIFYEKKLTMRKTK